MRRPALPRASSAISGFFFCGMIEDPVEKASSRRTNENSFVAHRMTSSAMRDRSTAVIAAMKENSATTSREAVASMGPNVTREGLMAWYRGLRDYDSGGLLTPGDYEPFQPTDGATVPNCFSVVRWDEGLGDFAMVEPPSHCVEGTWGTFSPVYEP